MTKWNPLKQRTKWSWEGSSLRWERQAQSPYNSICLSLENKLQSLLSQAVRASQSLHSVDSGKFAIPTADGTVLKLKSTSSAAAGKRCLSYKAESSWKGSYRVSLLICQCKQTDSENSVFSLQGKIYKRSYIFGANL